MAAVLCLSLSALVVPAAPASALTCKNSGGGNTQITVGSQVNGDIVTICASIAFQKQLKKVIKPVPKPAVKPAPKPAVKPVPKPAVKPAPKPVKKTVPNTIYKVKPVSPKPKVIKNTVTGNKSNTAMFRPTKPVARVSPSGQLRPGQAARFSSNLSVKYGTAVLLGSLVKVRFTPINWEWNFGDGQLESGPVLSTGSGSNTVAADHAFVKSGSYPAFIRVEYAVAYRVAGGGWLEDPDTIWLSSNGLNVLVGGGGGSGAGVTVLIKP
jgi:hypothetical protein